MAAPAKNGFKVLVTRVPWTVTSKELRDYFSKFGQVTRCVVPFNNETGFHKGHGFVHFETEEGCNNALQGDSHILEGSSMQVAQSENKFKSAPVNED